MESRYYWLILLTGFADCFNHSSMALITALTATYLIHPTNFLQGNWLGWPTTLTVNWSSLLVASTATFQVYSLIHSILYRTYRSLQLHLLATSRTTCCIYWLTLSSSTSVIDLCLLSRVTDCLTVACFAHWPNIYQGGLADRCAANVIYLPCWLIVESQSRLTGQYKCYWLSLPAVAYITDQAYCFIQESPAAT